MKGRGKHHSEKNTQRRPQRKDQDEKDPTEYLHLLNTGEAGLLEADEGERTWGISQERLLEQVPLQAAKKRFSLKLEGGPYNLDYSRNGRSLLIAGRRQGHVAAIEWESGKLHCELALEETVRDAKWLQGESMFAVAQRRYTYIYDVHGTELHRLEKFQEIKHLEYLPYHFLLASIGSQGVLRYQDITNGHLVAENHTRVGRCTAMRQNISNAIIHLGHAGGYLTLWSPNVGSPLVTMQCHASPIEAIAINPAGTYMATAGADGKIGVWDMRTYKKLHEYSPLRPATSLDISQRGLLAAAYGPHATIWKDGLARRMRNPYMHHLQAGEIINCIRFCPYDDVCALGHSAGIDSVLIPGAGEPNYDAFEANPMASRSQRREAEVKQLLDKLAPETIMLDPSIIGTVVRTEAERHEWKNEVEFKAAHPEGAVRKSKAGKKGPGKAALERMKRRQNIIETERRKDEIIVNSGRPAESVAPPHPLDRFKLKSL